VSLSVGADGLLHQFTPVVNVRRRDDGRFEVDIEWLDAYYGSYLADGTDVATTEDARDVDIDRACAAVDAWRTNGPRTFLIPDIQEGIHDPV
jgi:hypothetical protein